MPSDYVDLRYTDIKDINPLYAALTASSKSTNATATLDEEAQTRTIQGTCNSAAYGGMYFNATAVVADWVKGFWDVDDVVEMDVLDETEKEGSYIGIYFDRAHQSTEDYPATTEGYEKGRWTHIAVKLPSGAATAIGLRSGCRFCHV